MIITPELEQKKSLVVCVPLYIIICFVIMKSPLRHRPRILFVCFGPFFSWPHNQSGFCLKADNTPERRRCVHYCATDLCCYLCPPYSYSYSNWIHCCVLPQPGDVVVLQAVVCQVCPLSLKNN